MKRKSITIIMLTFVFLILSCVYVWSFAKLHMILGSGDLMFHANRAEKLYHDIQHGVVIPRISTYTFNEVGSGINFFYPWLLLYPWIFLRLIIHNPIKSFYVYIILETFVTFSISYYAMHKYSGSKKRAVIFYLLYTLANYRLYLVLNQNVLAESIAYTFVPIVLLGFYETFFRDKNNWPLLAIGMSMLIYSHMLTTALVACFLLITLLIFWSKIKRKLVRIISAGKAVVLSVLLTAFYLFPFFEQTLGSHVRASWTGLVLIKEPMRVINDSINNKPTQVIGFLLILTLIIGFRYLKHSPIVEKYSYLSGMLLTLLTTDLFPWYAFSKIPVSNLQFPYRLNGLATIMLCIYLSFVIESICNNLKDNYHINMSVSLLILVLITSGLTLTAEHHIINERSRVQLLDQRPTLQNYYPIKNHDSYNVTKENWHNMFYYYGHNGAFDYFPTKVKDGILVDVVMHKAIVDGKRISFNERIISKPNQLEYNLTGIKPGSTVRLPVLYYKNDVIKIGTSKFKKTTITKEDTIQVCVPKNNKKAIIKYQNSQLDNISIVVSLLTWLGLIVVYVSRIDRRKNENCETVSQTY